VRRYVIDEPGDPGAVLILDDTGGLEVYGIRSWT